MAEQCISCKKDVSNIKGTVKFPCPNCSNYQLVRCGECRAIAAKYLCPSCNFEGPN